MLLDYWWQFQFRQPHHRQGGLTVLAFVEGYFQSSYGYVALGEIIGWFIGWDLLLEYIAIVAVVAIGISGYFSAFLAGIGINMPDWAASTADEGRGGVVNIPAIAVCLLVTWSPGSSPAAPAPSDASNW